MTVIAPHEFDFIYGHWAVHNRKLRDNKNPDCVDWIEFNATSEVFPILHDLGHIDRMSVLDLPGEEPFEGFTLRLFDPETGTWSIYWSSTRVPGRLDPPVTGRFTGGHGVFECDDVIGDREVKVRFEWLADPTTPVWKQSFSYDSGVTWTINWVMTFNRISEV